MKLFELYAELGLDSSKFSSGVKKASQQGANLATSLKGGLGGATNFIGTKISATTVMLGHLMADVAKKGVQMVKDTASAGIKYNASMETYVTNFKTMLGGSSDAAKKLTGDLEAMAAATPFAMSDLADATQTLLAFGQDSSTVLDTLKNLGDIAMGDANKLSSLTLAFSQASSQGKLMGQDLMQMINAGFNPLQTIVDKTGASMGDLKEFMSTGKASAALKKQMREAKKEVKALGDQASDGAKMLVQMSKDGSISAEMLGQIFDIETSPGGRFYNAMAAASETFEGLMSTLEDDSNALLGKVFKPLSDWMTTDLLPNAIGAIGQISDAFDKGGLEGAVSKAVEIAGGYLSGLGKLALDAGSDLLANILTGLTGDTVTGPQISAALSGLWTDATAGLSALVTSGKTILTDILGGLTKDEDAGKTIKETLSGLFSGAASLATSLGKIGESFLSGILAGLEKDSDAETSIKETLSGLFSNSFGIASSLAKIGEGFLSGILDGFTKEEDAEKTIKEKLEGLFSGAGETVGTLTANAKNILKDIYDALNTPEAKKTAEDIGKKLGEILGSGTTFISDTVTESGKMLSGILAALKSDPKSLADIKAFMLDLFGSIQSGLDGIVLSSGEFLSNLYAAITGDKEGAKKLEGLLKTPVEAGSAAINAGTNKFVEGTTAWASVVKKTAEELGITLNDGGKKGENTSGENNGTVWDKVSGAMMEALKASLWLTPGMSALMTANGMAGGFMDFGTWLDKKMTEGGTGTHKNEETEQGGGGGYFEDPANKSNSTWKPNIGSNRWTPGGLWSPSARKSSDDGETPDLKAAVQSLTTAAAELATSAASAAAEAAAGAISGAKVEMDGRSVGSIVLPFVTAAIGRETRISVKARSPEP